MRQRRRHVGGVRLLIGQRALPFGSGAVQLGSGAVQRPEAGPGGKRGDAFRPSGRWSVVRWVSWPGTGAPAVAVVAIVSALATLLSWRAVAWRPVLAGLNSWQAGITLGFLHHLQWGPQLLFTFGPYGFVEDILPYSHLTATLGFLYALIVAWGVAALIVSALRGPWGLLPAGVAAWTALAIAANLVEAPELGVALALGLALASFGARDGGGRPAPAPEGVAAAGWAPAAGGAAAGWAPAAAVRPRGGLRRRAVRRRGLRPGRQGRRGRWRGAPSVRVEPGQDLWRGRLWRREGQQRLRRQERG